MNQIFVLALVAFATINAAPLTANSDSDVKAAKVDLSGVLSKNIDQNIIDSVIAFLDQQAGSGDAINKRVDKATVLKKLASRRMKLVGDVEEAQPKVDSKVELLMKKHETKIAQLKKQVESPENLKKLDDFKLLRERIHDVPANIKIPKRMQEKAEGRLGEHKAPTSFSKREVSRSFKLPAHIQLPEKFQRKLNM